MNETAQMMNFLLKNSAPNLPSGVLADIFARLAWTLEDNGHEIVKTLKLWLDSDDDSEKARIALEFDEIYLWDSVEECERDTNEIARRRPQLEDLCRESLAGFAAAPPGGRTNRD